MRWDLLLAVAAGVVVAAAVVVVPTVVVLRRQRTFTARSLPAPAVITGIRRSFAPYRGGGLRFSARVGFTTAQGIPVSTEIRLYGPGTQPRVQPGAPPVRVGQPIPIQYDPVDPRRADIDLDRMAGPAPSPQRRRTALILACVLVFVLLIILAPAVIIVAAST